MVAGSTLVQNVRCALNVMCPTKVSEASNIFSRVNACVVRLVLQLSSGVAHLEIYFDKVILSNNALFSCPFFAFS